MPDFTAPGVYVGEINNLPPSVSEAESAIPAFMGYTFKKSGKNQPIQT